MRWELFILMSHVWSRADVAATDGIGERGAGGQGRAPSWIRILPMAAHWVTGTPRQAVLQLLIRHVGSPAPYIRAARVVGRCADTLPQALGARL